MLETVHFFSHTERSLCGTTKAVRNILVRLDYNTVNLTRNFSELSGEEWRLRGRQALLSQ